MKALIKKFWRCNQDAHDGPLAPAAAAPEGPPVPTLNQPLSKKSKAAVPASFFAREEWFRAKAPPAAVKGPVAVVRPREEGMCQVKQGRFTAAWGPARCSLDGRFLSLHTPAAASAPAASAKLKIRLDLVGAHLVGQPDSMEFVITEANCGAGAAWHIRVPNQLERNEWMVALAKVPGLFRRAEDYYELHEAWGHGATCEVHACVGRFDGRRLALKKRLHCTRDATVAMHNELRILQICAKHAHPAIPQLEDFFFDTDGRIELVMELMEGGELFDWIAAREGELTEGEARAVFRQVVAGVAHLHSLGIAHRDLKPQNLMYTRPAKVNYGSEWEGATPCGTMHYMAPEIVRRERYSLAVDCWSLGVVLYILLCGRLPFDGRDSRGLEEAIDKGTFHMAGPLWQGVSQEAQDLVTALLKADPAERLTAQQCLEHPWMAVLAAAAAAEGGATSDGEVQQPGAATAQAGSREAAAAGGVTYRWDAGGEPGEGGRSLRTVANLRQLSGSLASCSDGSRLAAISEADDRLASGSSGSRSGSLGLRLMESMGSRMPGGSPTRAAGSARPLASPLRHALDYDLSSVRQRDLHGEEDAVQGLEGSSHSGRTFQEYLELERLKVQLDLVGTEGGIQDSRAAAARGGRPLGLGSPQPSCDALFSGVDAHFGDLQAEEVDSDGGEGGSVGR